MLQNPDMEASKHALQTGSLQTRNSRKEAWCFYTPNKATTLCLILLNLSTASKTQPQYYCLLTMKSANISNILS